MAVMLLDVKYGSGFCQQALGDERWTAWKTYWQVEQSSSPDVGRFQTDHRAGLGRTKVWVVWWERRRHGTRLAVIG